MIEFIFPGSFGIQKCAPLGCELNQPAAEGFMIHDGIMIIAFLLEFFQRLIADKIETSHRLVNAVI
jgi:hypothetical protein